MLEPRRLLIVDEPTKGLAPAVIEQLIEAFRQLQGGGDDHPAGGAELPHGPLAR